jgi:hypothetical protein
MERSEVALDGPEQAYPQSTSALRAAEPAAKRVKTKKSLSLRNARSSGTCPTKAKSLGIGFGDLFGHAKPCLDGLLLFP